MFDLSKAQRVTPYDPQLNNNFLRNKELKEIYKKILANIMSKNEIGALSWVKKLQEREIKQVSKEQQLAWFYPWPCTLIESAEATGAERVKTALSELV